MVAVVGGAMLWGPTACIDVPGMADTEDERPQVPEAQRSPTIGTQGCQAYLEPKEIGRLHESLAETSGIVASGRHGYFWAHNDSGDGPTLYGFDSTGALTAKVWLSGVSATDWEDIARGPCAPSDSRSCLYIGDVGDNGRHRSSVKIYRIPEPDPAGGDRTVYEVETMRLRYPGRGHDAEALVVDERARVFLFTKEGDARTDLFFAPFVAGEAPLREAFTWRLRDLPHGDREKVTGADYDPASGRLLLRTYSSILEAYVSPGPGLEAAGSSTWRVVPSAQERQGEAVALTGRGYVQASEDRGARLYEVRCAEAQPPEPRRPQPREPEEEDPAPDPPEMDPEEEELGEEEPEEEEPSPEPPEEDQPGAQTPNPPGETARCQAFAAAQRTGALSAEIHEASGLVASGRSPGVFWTHNDSGDAPRVYAIDESGALLAVVTLDVPRAVDWEDIALGPCGQGSCLYIADTGDNNADREEVLVHRIPEPDALLGNQTVGGVETARLRYPDRPRNSEGLVVSRDGVFLFTRTAGETQLYGAPFAERATLEKISEWGLTSLPHGADEVVTAADLDPGGRAVLLRTYSSILEIDLGAGGLPASRGARWRTLPSVSLPQAEAVAYHRAGGHVETSEGTGAALWRTRCR